MPLRIARVSAFALLFSASVTAPLGAQLGSLRDRLKQKVAEKVVDKSDSAARGLTGRDSAVRVQRVESQGTAAAARGRQPADSAGGLWLNFDFVPGEDVLFADDFSSDVVGDFPKRLQFKEGNVEVAQAGTARLLRLSSNTGSFNVILPTKLPDRFTLEFDLMPIPGFGQEIRFTDDKPASRPPFGVVTVECYEPTQCDGGIRTSAAWSKSVAPDAFTHQLIRVRVMSDGKYAKVYMNGTRVANVPDADLGRSRHIVFDLRGDEKIGTLVGPITVAAGGRKLYDALATNGRVATHGIFFDVGSDRIRPESGPTLKEIAAMLAEHGSLKLVIEGHTDDQGDPATNQELSERRAAAVKQALTDSFGVDQGRLSAKGAGASKPMTPNATPEGRQQNRRVELVRS